jgi:hypothetical protein
MRFCSGGDGVITITTISQRPAASRRRSTRYFTPSHALDERQCRAPLPAAASRDGRIGDVSDDKEQG